MILKQGDCLDLMKDIPDKSVDMILCDLPYGTTFADWDVNIPMDKIWKEYKRVIKNHGAILLFGVEPFSSMLRISSQKMYRYDWIWKKNQGTGFMNVRKMPLRNFENISVFYKHLPTYNPQMVIGKRHRTSDGKSISDDTFGINTHFNQALFDKRKVYTKLHYPGRVIEFSTPHNKRRYHPTQKPVELLKYLIHTYTNEGDTVLDNTMGSGSTGVACVDTHRDFIGYELDEHYFNVARQRIKEAENSLA